MSHRHMSHMPSHGSASHSNVGNAGHGAAHYAPGRAGGHAMEASCMFPAPPPKRVYCSPAAFTSIDGRSHHRILDAYGNSRPATSYY